MGSDVRPRWQAAGKVDLSLERRAIRRIDMDQPVYCLPVRNELMRIKANSARLAIIPHRQAGPLCESELPSNGEHRRET
jgi:hypothetical protein